MSRLNRREMLGSLGATASGLTCATLLGGKDARAEDKGTESAGTRSADVDSPLRQWPGDGDWKRHWNEPLRFPRQTGPGRWDIAAHTAKRRAIALDAAECGLVLVDIGKEAFDFQVQDLTRHDPQLGRYVEARIYDIVLLDAIRLVEFFRAQKIPVIFVQWDWHRFQYPPLEPRAGEPVVPKTTTGAFASPNLGAVLAQQNVRTPVFMGADTAFCLESTVRGAVDPDFARWWAKIRVCAAMRRSLSPRC